jgi:hypothetical protein
LEFPDAFIKTLPRLEFSDHHPILICPFGNDVNKAPRRFRFENAWHLHANYKDMVKSCWTEGDSVVRNLKSLQSEFKKWNCSTFNQVLHQKRRLEARIGGIQSKIAIRRTSYGLRRIEEKLQHELSDILKQEEIMWFQRSRAKWLKDGDRNTRYYHLKTTHRHKRNNIVMLRMASGEWVDDQQELQSMVNEYYQHLFAKPNGEWN